MWAKNRATRPSPKKFGVTKGGGGGPKKAASRATQFTNEPSPGSYHYQFGASLFTRENIQRCYQSTFDSHTEERNTVVVELLNRPYKLSRRYCPLHTGLRGKEQRALV